MGQYFIDRHGDCKPEIGGSGNKWAVYELDSSGYVIDTLFQPYAKQSDFIGARKRYVMADSNRGSGKSEMLIWKAIATAHLIPGAPIPIFRRVLQELQITIIDRMKKLPEQLTGKYVGASGKDQFRLKNGSRIYCLSSPDEKHIRKTIGAETPLVIIDEWCEWPYSLWSFLDGIVRWPEAADIDGEAIVAQIIGATNPFGQGKADLQRLFGAEMKQQPCQGMVIGAFRPDNYQRIHMDIDDNPAYARGTPQGDAYREAMAAQPTARRIAWSQGSWINAIGAYFDKYNRHATVIPHDQILQLLGRQSWAIRWISGDWGFRHHFYVAWHCWLEIDTAHGPKKFVVTYRENLDKGMSERAFGEEICSMTPKDERPKISRVYLSPDLGFSDPLSRGYKIGDTLVSGGLPRGIPAYNDRVDGWQIMYEKLAERHVGLPVLEGNGEVEELSGWLISDRCEHLAEALSWAECSEAVKYDGDIKAEPKDAPELDVLDGARYGIASSMKHAEKPFAVTMLEAMGKLPAIGADRFIMHLRIREKQRELTDGCRNTRLKYPVRGRQFGRR
jgi:hypothetical protein